MLLPESVDLRLHPLRSTVLVQQAGSQQLAFSTQVLGLALDPQ